MYLFDGLHSTRQLVGSTALVSDSYTYDSFGNTLIASGLTVNPFRYVGGLGYYFDIDTQQSNLRARYYDPIVGAFLAETRSYLVSGRTCIYADNRPISLTDPSGLKPGVITFPPPISPSHPRRGMDLLVQYPTMENSNAVHQVADTTIRRPRRRGHRFRASPVTIRTDSFARTKG